MGWFLPAAIIGSAVIGAAGSYLGSKSSSKGADKAADAQAQASVYATDVQREMYEQGRTDLAPWRRAGVRSLQQLEGLQGTYKKAVLDPSGYLRSPGYNWLQEQGIDALNRGASASGALDSGARSKDLVAFGQGLASQDYQGYLGRLESLMNRYAGTAQVGQTASSQLAGLGQAFGQSAGQNALYAGQAQAGGYINQANARTGLYQNLANIGISAVNQYSMYNYLNRSPGLQQPQQAWGQSNLNQMGYE